MHDASFRGVHRGHLHGPSLAYGPTGGSVGHALDRLDAALAVSLCVEHHSLEERALPKRGYVDEVLKGVDSLALLSYEQCRIIRGDIGGYKTSRVVDLHAGIEA